MSFGDIDVIGEVCGCDVCSCCNCFGDCVVVSCVVGFCCYCDYCSSSGGDIVDWGGVDGWSKCGSCGINCVWNCYVGLIDGCCFECEVCVCDCYFVVIDWSGCWEGYGVWGFFVIRDKFGVRYDGYEVFECGFGEWNSCLNCVIYDDFVNWCFVYLVDGDFFGGCGNFDFDVVFGKVKVNFIE